MLIRIFELAAAYLAQFFNSGGWMPKECQTRAKCAECCHESVMKTTQQVVLALTKRPEPTGLEPGW